ncbi:hypothetical protein NQ318_014061 [Aromia moschata]|uniref:Uncharacterized protein n=1 Tax=Aromia moschata TaxID=1265417 RepID=A0AAV8Z013_9CUCU|nr:hypothetical protein NQ318_014061 [Aromia moschata]
MVPKLLTPEQKESRINICADILYNIDSDSGLLDTAITYYQSNGGSEPALHSTMEKSYGAVKVADYDSEIKDESLKFDSSL